VKELARYLSAVFAVLACLVCIPLSSTNVFAQGNTYGTIKVDGSLADWTTVDRLDLFPWQGSAGAELYGTFGTNNFVFGLKSPLIAAGATITIWINADRNPATGYQIFGIPGVGGAEYNASFLVGQPANLYTGAAGQNLVAGGVLDYVAVNGSLEIAIPKARIGSGAGGINVLVSITNGTTTSLPSDFSLFQYTQPETLRPVRTSAGKRIGIVYSATTASRYFDTMAYSELFMSAQHQAMMAGIPYDVLEEADLNDVANVVNYDTLIFPYFSNIPAASRAAIERTLSEAAHRYKIGIITAGDFVTNSETGVALPGDPYQAMKAILGLTPASSGGPVNFTLNGSGVSHPANSGYASNELIVTYTGGFWRTFNPVAGVTTTTIANQKVGAANNPGVLATQFAGRNVFFTTDRFLGDTNLGWSAIRWSVYGTATPVALQMGRQDKLFFARNDMDQSMFADEYSSVKVPLKALLDQWKTNYNFVGSYYINIGENPVENEFTDWAVSGPYYKSLLAAGNEVGNHSYTHPDDTNLLTADQRRHQFLDACTQITANLAIPCRGIAVPGNPDTLPTALDIVQYSDYTSGRYSGFNAGYPSAFGFLTPNSSKVYFSPNMLFDFTLVEFQKKTPAQAEAIWKADFDTISSHASQPIIHWPWHDYGPTTSANLYTTTLYSNFLAYAFGKDVEFVHGVDLTDRLHSLLTSSLTVDQGTTVKATVAGANLGRFSLLPKQLNVSTQVIQKVVNWYAYSSSRVFLPEAGGTFDITLGATQDGVTRISALPMRATLKSLTGNGKDIDFVVNGAGKVTLTLNPEANLKFEFTGADSFVQTGQQVVATFLNEGDHTVKAASWRCGDGVVYATKEQCDDGNVAVADGCSATCTVESGYVCTGQPSVCAKTCGNGTLDAGEQCDDKNTTSSDGCSAQCTIEPGYSCTGTPSMCATSCGDGVKAGAEQCDDKNKTSGDGCSALCTIEPGYTCTGTPSVCSLPSTEAFFYSVGGEDGWLRGIASNNSSVAVTASNNSSSGLRVGDESRNYTYRSILSFDTSSLPDNAVVVSAKLELRRGSTTGSNPWPLLGNVIISLKKGFFGGSAQLGTDDFGAAPDFAQGGSFGNLGGSGTLYSIPLASQGVGFVNLQGRTQLRLGFATPTNNDGKNSFAGFYPGEASTRDRPRLRVVYQAPK